MADLWLAEVMTVSGNFNSDISQLTMSHKHATDTGAMPMCTSLCFYTLLWIPYNIQQVTTYIFTSGRNFSFAQCQRIQYFLCHQQQYILQSIFICWSETFLRSDHFSPTFGLMVAVLNWAPCSLGGGTILSSSSSSSSPSLLLLPPSSSSSSTLLLSPSTDVLSDVDDSVSLGSKESLFTEPLGDDPLFLGRNSCLRFMFRIWIMLEINTWLYLNHNRFLLTLF